MDIMDNTVPLPRGKLGLVVDDLILLPEEVEEAMKSGKAQITRGGMTGEISVSKEEGNLTIEISMAESEWKGMFPKPLVEEYIKTAQDWEMGMTL